MTLSRLDIFKRAFPIILANASVPLLSLADTAMMGYFGSVQDLAALAIVTVLFNMIFWSFGFLRMSTTGLVAQQSGFTDSSLMQETILRSLSLALLFSLALIVLQWPIKTLSFFIFDLTPNTLLQSEAYYNIRIWGAPATLVYYCLCGILIGLGKSKWLLFFQLVLNSVNVLLNFIFVYFINLGVLGLAVGTVISEFVVTIFALLLINQNIHPILSNRSVKAFRSIVFKIKGYGTLLALNRDIFLRTLFLLLSFMWFTRQAAQLGDTVTAATQILLSIISFTAFFLDGFAFVAEAEVGKQFGHRNIQAFKRAVKYTTEAAAVTALCFALILFFFGGKVINLLTDLESVQKQANSLLPFCCAYIAISFAAFQLDGIFIGTTQAKAMRNASLISFIGFIASYYSLTYIDALSGLWLSFIGYISLRAVTLGLSYPKLLRTCKYKAADDLSKD